MAFSFQETVADQQTMTDAVGLDGEKSYQSVEDNMSRDCQWIVTSPILETGFPRRTSTLSSVNVHNKNVNGNNRETK
jgi:hypothetical protein